MSEQTHPGEGLARSLSDELDRYRFVDRLDNAIKDLAEPANIADTAARLLGDYLVAEGCVYIDESLCEARGEAEVEAGADADTDTGWHRFSAGLARIATDDAGVADTPSRRPPMACIVDDTAADRRADGLVPLAMDALPGAFAAVPVRQDTRILAWMMIWQAVPRHWAAHDIELLAIAARRCHEFIERNRMGTELRNAEKRIRANHDYLRLLIDSGDEGFYSVDRDGVTVMCNTAFLNMLGFEREEDAVGRKLHGVIHHRHPDGSDYAVCDCPIYQSARFGSSAHVEDELFFRADGTPFPVEYRALPVWQDGELQGAVCTFVDVTERRRTEQALQESQAHLDSLFAQAGAGISETDLTGRLLRMNERFCRIVGRSRDELLRMRMHDITHPDDLARNVPLFERAVATGTPFEIEKRYVRPDGSVVWVNNTVSPVRGPNGRPAENMLAVSVDVSERKHAEEALRETDRRKDEFLAMLAHELRNPMAPIRAAADLMAVARLAPEQLRRTSQIISRQVSHMTGLVDDLLDVSRVTRGLVTLDQADLDMKQVVADALEQARPLIEQKNHHLTLDLDAAPAHVMGDHKRLIQILTNLLSNAAKYTPHGGNIHLTMQVEARQVRLHVADNGIGIPPDLRPRIFDLFAQAERSPDRSQGGLGIGLALVKSLVELHGGRVACESGGTGSGSDFIVTLPRAARPPPADPSAPEAAGEPHGVLQPRRILLVDDNVDAARMLAMYLEVVGHAVMVEHTARGALARAGREHPDVCVLDIGLPEIDGNTLARMLRDQPGTAHALLIALTGYGQEQDRERAMAAGFDHFLVKPVDSGAMLALISSSSGARA